MNRLTRIRAKQKIGMIGIGLLIAGIAAFGVWCLYSWTKIEIEQVQEEQQRNSWSDEYEDWKNNRNTELPEDLEDDAVDPNLQIFHSQMKDQNEDYAAWLEIPGTGFSTPVVQGSADDLDWYLTHNFNKEYSNWGCPFIRCPSSLETANMFIYGHHIRHGQMFSVLDDYTDQAWKDEHETILLTTENEVRVYKVFCVFTMSMNNPPFQWNAYYNFAPATFDEYISTIEGYNFITSDIVPRFGDKIMTLVTCEYTHANGRLVVMAVQTDSLTTAKEISDVYSSGTVQEESN